MNPLSPDTPTRLNVVIHLDQGDSSAPQLANQLVQRERYENLKGEITKHLHTLAQKKLTCQSDWPAGSGWVQFIDGTRGAGKSTFLSSTRLALESDPEVKNYMAFIAQIDPSRIENSEVILLVILQHLRQRVEEALRGQCRQQDEHLVEEWRRCFKGVAGGLSLFSKEYHPLDGLDPDLFLDWGLERACNSTNLRIKLHRLFETACKILGKNALMLTFDDADTNAEHAINILECIRKYLDTPLVMVLLTGDMELYSLLLRQHFAQTVAGKREAAIELQRLSAKGDRSSQYLRMISHLEEQYLLKLFPIHRRMQLHPLWNVMLTVDCTVSYPSWEDGVRPVMDVIHSIVKQGLRVKTKSDIATYSEFLLKQPLRSVLQVMASCAPYLGTISNIQTDTKSGSKELTRAISRSLQALALTSLYKFSVDTDAIAARELPALTQAVFELSLVDGDIDTAPYLRPMSSENDIRSCFSALAAEVPNFCSQSPGTALRYLLRGPGSVSIFSISHTSFGEKDSALPQERIEQFKSYIGIGRREDGLDWARRTTAIIGFPNSINPKARVILPGVIGLSRQGRTGENAVRTALRNAISHESVSRLPIFALGLVHVSSASGPRTFGSIFILVGLIEKLLSISPYNEDEARKTFERVYPSLTVSAPNWMSQGTTEDQDESESNSLHKPSSKEVQKQTQLWDDISAWRKAAFELAETISPSAIFLGKVWTRLFFSLQNASVDLKPRAPFGEVMEIFSLCVINAFLVEEAEHHLPNSPNTPIDLHMDRNNPRTAAIWFVGKLTALNPQREDFPFTSIIATCPLLLGLLDESLGYAKALQPLFPKDTSEDSIKEILCPKSLRDFMDKVSVMGESQIKKTAPRRPRKPAKTSTSSTPEAPTPSPTPVPTGDDKSQ